MQTLLQTFFGKKKIKDFPFKFGKININPRNLDESSTSAIPLGATSEASSENATENATENPTGKPTENPTNKQTENKESNSTLKENLLLGFDNYKYNNSIL